MYPHSFTFAVLLIIFSGLFAQVEICSTIATSLDDVEQRADGSIYTTSTDIEMVVDNGNQIIGLRFSNINVPPSACISSAYIQFTTDEVNTGATNLTIAAVDQANTATFSTSNNAISNLSLTSSTIAWSPPDWNLANQAGPDQQTPDLSSLIEEVIAKPGYLSGNAIAFVIAGTGERTAESYDGSTNAAPQLCISYVNCNAGSNCPVGAPDSDCDNVCDAEDVCPDFDDNLDIDDDGIPYCQDNCIDVNKNGICDQFDNSPIDENLNVFFSQERGYFKGQFQLSLIANKPNAVIRYTTDHTLPTATNGATYSGPLLINGSTILRVYASLSGENSKVKTKSFFFLNEIKNESYLQDYIMNNPTYASQFDGAMESIPTVSIINLDSLDDDDPKQVSFEYFFKKEQSSDQENCGGKLYGNASVNTAKQNHRFFFRSEFGSKKFKEDIFETIDNGMAATNDFDHIELRGDAQESFLVNFSNTHTYIGPRFCDNTMLAMGNRSSQGRFVHFFKNGIYMGQYHMRERMNDNFMVEYFGGVQTDYESIDCAGSGNLGGIWTPGTPYDGSGALWNTVVAAVNNYSNWKNYINESSLYDFMLLWMWGNHENEAKIVGNHNGETEFMHRNNDGDGVFTLYDADIGAVNLDRTDPNGTGSHNAAGHHDMFKTLYNSGNIDFRLDFADRAACHCFNNGALTSSQVDNRIDLLKNEMSSSIVPETARWGNPTDNYIPEDVWSQLDQVQQNFTPTRTTNLIQLLKNRGLYPSDNEAVDFGQIAGVFPSGFQLVLNNSNNTQTYYTLDGTDPRNSGGGLSGSAILYTGPFTLPDGVHEVIARNRNTAYGTGNINRWSAMCKQSFFVGQDYDDLVINELHYNPNDSIYFNSTINAIDTIEGKDFEFIEIVNAGTKDINLRGLILKGAVQYEWLTDEIIPPGDFVVLANDLIAFDQKYKCQAHGEYKGNFSNSSEDIFLLDPKNNLLDWVSYSDNNPWPSLADKGLFSLALLDPSLDNSKAENWAVQPTLTTVKAANNFSLDHPICGLVINEIHYHPLDSINPALGLLINDDFFEFIELKNETSQVIDISKAFFSRGINYTFPDNTILLPGEIIVLCSDYTWFQARYGFPAYGEYTGKLDNGGETIWLNDAAGNLIDEIEYDDEAPWATEADGSGPSLALEDCLENNSNPSSWKPQIYNHTAGEENQFSTCIPENFVNLPTGLNEVIDWAAGTLTVSWDAYPFSTACMIRAWYTSLPANKTVIYVGNINSPESPTSRSFALTAIPFGIDFQWDVVCGCSVDPLMASPFSQPRDFRISISPP